MLWDGGILSDERLCYGGCRGATPRIQLTVSQSVPPPPSPSLPHSPHVSFPSESPTPYFPHINPLSPFLLRGLPLTPQVDPPRLFWYPIRVTQGCPAGVIQVPPTTWPLGGWVLLRGPASLASHWQGHVSEGQVHDSIGGKGWRAGPVSMETGPRMAAWQGLCWIIS